MLASKALQRLGKAVAGRRVIVVLDNCPEGVNGFSTYGVKTFRAPWVIIEPRRDPWDVLTTLCHECLHWKSNWPRQGDYRSWSDIVAAVGTVPGNPDALSELFVKEEYRVRAGAAALVKYARRFEGNLEEVADKLAAAIESGEVRIVDDVQAAPLLKPF